MTGFDSSPAPTPAPPPQGGRDAFGSGYSVTRRGRSSEVAALATLALVAALVFVPFVEGPDITYKLVNLFVIVVLASMWNLLAGYGGLVSIGQQAFIGIGAYSLLWLSQEGVGVYVAIPLAGLVAALVALPTSHLAFRLHGGYFAVGTWVIAEVFRLVVVQIGRLGGGSGASLTGLSGLDPALRQAYTYWVALAVTVAVLLGMYLLLRSRLGLGLTAIRDSQGAAGSLGVEVDRSKRVVFLLAALGCGAAGALVLANSLRVQPDSAFGVQWTAYMVFCVIIGGLGTIEGPLIGAVLFFLLQDRLAAYGASYLILLGAVAIVMTVAVPQGIWGLITSATPLRLFPISHRLRWAPHPLPSSRAGEGQGEGGRPNIRPDEMAP